MKLKELNDELESIIDVTLKELSTLYSKQTGEEFKFEFWSDTRHTDLDKNICYIAVLDVRKIVNEKVVSFKRLYDRMLIQRENTNHILTPVFENEKQIDEVKEYNRESPTYGKQRNVEELRKTVLRELIGKAIGGFALGMSERTKEQIQDLYKSMIESVD